MAASPMSVTCSARRRRSRRGLLFLVSACVASSVNGTANIDVGFAQDGKTTYCHGVKASGGPLVFDGLELSSAGKCPIDVQISASASTIQSLAPLTVRWLASAHQGALATNLFPNAVDKTTKKPQDVIASLLRACKAGSNCAIPETIVEPAVVEGDTSTDTGAFDASGVKTLKSYQFQFPTAGEDFVIVAKVVLPGDPQLNVSAQEFVAFQRVKVGDTTVPTMPNTGTVKPADTSSSVADDEALVVPSSSSATTTGPPLTSGSNPSASGSSTATGSGGVNMQTIAIIGVAGIVVILLVVGYSVLMVKEKREQQAMAPQQRHTRSLTLSFHRQDPDLSPTGVAAGGVGPTGPRPSAARHNQHADPRIGRASDQYGPPEPKPLGDTAASGGLGMTGDFTGRGMTKQSPPRYTLSRDSRYSTISNVRPSLAAMSAGMGMSFQNLLKPRNGPPPPPELRTPSIIHVPKERTSSVGSRPLAATRGVSTSSTKSEDYSSEGSAFSLGAMSGADSYGESSILGRAERVSSYGDPAILGEGPDSRFSSYGELPPMHGAGGQGRDNRAFSVDRRSTVVLLESSTAGSDRSSLSSIGSIHDTSEHVPLSSLGSSRDLHKDSASSSMLSSFGDDHTGVSAIYRPSSNVFRASSHVFRPSSNVLRQSANPYASSVSSSARDGSFYARDTSEFDAPFSSRHSESDWDRLSVDDELHQL